MEDEMHRTKKLAAVIERRALQLAKCYRDMIDHGEPDLRKEFEKLDHDCLGEKCVKALELLTIALERFTNVLDEEVN